MHKQYHTHFIWLLLTLTISACGFHLKGTQRAQSNIDSLYLVINGQDEITNSAIQDIMEKNHIALVDAKDSRFEVRISNSIHQRNRTAVGGDLGDVEEIDVIDGFNVSIREDGDEVAHTTITSRTTISYASDQYLGSREEETRAHTQLARDNADKLLRYIDARLNKL